MSTSHRDAANRGVGPILRPEAARSRRNLERQINSLRSVKDEPSGEKADAGKPAGELPADGVSANEARRPSGGLKPLDISVPDEIGRYTIGRRIGSGTCGVVHQGLDNVLNREVAVKLSPVGEAHVSTGKVPGAQRAYQTEIVAAGRLAHPNIVTVHDAGQFEELNYLVMEVVHGRSLKEYGKGRKRLPSHQALAVIAACCRALDYSHRQGILHRDIKPANIMLSNDGVVKLLDFGIAVGLSGKAGLNKQGPTLGTPNYMSPEQILGRELGPPSDFYSLATVLFELLTGRQLFKAGKVKELFRTVVHQPPPPLHEVDPRFPDGLSRVLARALSKKPAARYQSGSEMAEALEPWIDMYQRIEIYPGERQQEIFELARVGFFRHFTFIEIAELLEHAERRQLDAGDLVLLDGNVDRRLIIVVDGLAKVSESGRFKALLERGQCFGEAAFINGDSSNEECRALTALEVLDISTDALSALPPKMHLHYYRRISEQLDMRKAGDSGTLIIDHLL